MKQVSSITFGPCYGSLCFSAERPTLLRFTHHFKSHSTRYYPLLVSFSLILSFNSEVVALLLWVLISHFLYVLSHFIVCSVLFWWVFILFLSYVSNWMVGLFSKLMNKAVEICCFNGWFITALFVSISLLTYIVRVDLIGLFLFLFL